MRSNLTILELNTLMGFEHEDTQELYLRGAQKDELKAFDMANKWEKTFRPFFKIVRCFGLYPEKAVDEVTDFACERHFRIYFPNNIGSTDNNFNKERKYNGFR